MPRGRKISKIRGSEARNFTERCNSGFSFGIPAAYGCSGRGNPLFQRSAEGLRTSPLLCLTLPGKIFLTGVRLGLKVPLNNPARASGGLAQRKKRPPPTAGGLFYWEGRTECRRSDPRHR